MMKGWLFALALLAGCSGLYRAHRFVAAMPAVATEHEVRCDHLDFARGAWGVGSTGLSVLAGGASTVMTITQNQTALYVLAGGAVGFSVLSVLAGYLQGIYLERYTKQCTVTP